MSFKEKQHAEGKHYCDINSPNERYGPAIDCCYENEKMELWVENSEYATQVNFCPCCGCETKIKYKEGW